MKKLISFLLLSIVYINGFGTTYYVSTSSGGTNSGTLSNPYTSLSSVASHQGSFGAGDFILFLRGDTFTGSITITVSGTAGNYITFGAYGSGARPVFTGNGTSTLGVLFYTNNHNYLKFDNLTIYDPTLVGTPTGTVAHIRIGWEFDGTSNHNIVQFCDASFIGDGVELIADDNIVSDCDFGYLRLIVNDATAFNDFGANPIDLKGKRNQIIRNHFHHTICQSFDYGFDGGALEFYEPTGGMDDNFIGYNTIELNVGVLEITGSGDRNVFAYNKFINNGATIYFHNNFSATFTGWKYINNIIIENVANSTGDALLFGNQGGNFSSGQLSLYNNIFYLTTGMKVSSNGTNLTHTNNTYYNFSGGSSIGYTAGGSEVTTSSAIWANTSGSVYGWDINPLNSTVLSTGINPASDISPYTVDLFGHTITSPYYMGVAQYYVAPPTTKDKITFPAKINGKVYSKMY